jgi:8-oxo-dGTP diphosphatase
MSTPAGGPLPYKIACLCDLRDERGRVLLLHRVKPPNSDLYSPIGGKLDMETGESPTANARREILEEAELDVPMERLCLAGIVSEAAFEGRGHWLIFYYRVLGPVSVQPRTMAEGRLDWYDPREIDRLAVPDTDRRIIWPLIRRHDDPRVNERWDPSRPPELHPRPGFFSVHIACTGPDGRDIAWTVEQERPR